MKKVITSESVNIGHPDKTCDYIADSFLDEALKQDKNSQMAVECAIKNDKLFIYGEASTKAKIDYEEIARKILKEIGYTCDFTIIKEISEQSEDINKAVVKNNLCANDQGIVYGYATNETKEFMPLPIIFAHKLMRKYEEFRKNSYGFFADAKSQVSILYEDDEPKEILSIVISVSHREELNLEDIRKLILDNVVLPISLEYKELKFDVSNVLINPSEKFTIWGSFSDSGCVGRKIIVDTYGGVGRVGGGCFSSKNATKVDRSGAYYARYIAKNIVAKGYAKRCEIGLSFAIGKEEPTSVSLECFGTNNVPMVEIEDFVKSTFSLKLNDIIYGLDLLKPIYKDTACYGHFGREEFSWEQIIK